MKTLLDEILEMEASIAKHPCGCYCAHCLSRKTSHSAGCNCSICRQNELFGEVDELWNELSNSALQNAVAYNRSRSDSLGWGTYLYDIVNKLFKLNFSPNETLFAEKVAQWQAANGLLADGKLGSGTWKAMQRVLGLSGGSATPSTPSSNPPSNPLGTRVYFPSGEYLTVTTGNTGPGQEHWDILGSGNPLLDTSGANKEKFLSSHFKVKEFTKGQDMARIDVKLVEALQKLRNALGKSITITSGYRSYGYNKRLYEGRGKTPTKSQHISGRAVDCNVAGLNGLQLAKEALKACGCDIAIGLGWTFIHLDVRGKYTPGYKFAVWDYAGGGMENWIAEVKQFRRSLCP
jgi:hypothetical protein